MTTPQSSAHPNKQVPTPLADGLIIKLVSAIAGGLLFLLATGAFVLSYSALRQVALSFGLPPVLAYIWPVLLDAAMVIFSLAVLRGSLRGERTLYPWILTGLFAFLALGGNVYHAPDSILADLIPKSIMSPIIWGIPPVALLLAFELLMSQIKAEVHRHSATVMLTDLAAQIKTIRQQIADLKRQKAAVEAERAAAAEKVKALRAEIKQLQQQKRKAKPAEVSEATREQARAILTRWYAEGKRGRQLNGSELGRLLDKSERLGRELKNELLPEIEAAAALVAENGNGRGTQ